ncbi:matrilysin-like [Mytilus californianus]|uniref:matrilysin-like n=1 Tax=Mytilus californianus TaxID=6549 RepID=UPI0022464FEF|nr:matrilysin-like [Mytilus californianus]
MILIGFFTSSLGLYRHRHVRAVNDGDTRAADSYLEQFGYMSSAKSFQLHSTSERTEALKSFQKFNNLPITGKLDQETVNKMNSPRCGVPDMEPGADGLPKPYKTGPKWTKKNLSWRVADFSDRLSNSVVKSEIARALKAWSDVADLSFTEVNSGEDIKIKFVTGDHGDGYAFDGTGGVLAHAFFPQNGDAHFDDGELWVVNTTGTDLFIVAAHEFGHSLGLDHSSNNDALMAPIYTGYIPNYQLHSDDIAGIRSLYGEQQNPSPTDSPRPTPAVTVTPPVDNRPELCQNGYEATIKNTNGEYLFFVKPKHVMMMTAENGLYRTEKTKTVFKKSPRKVDGAFILPDTNNTYFIKGKKLYEFDSEGIRTRVLKIKGGRKSMPEKTRAAFAVSENQVYMLGDSMVWQLDLSTLTISSESIKSISEEFPGLSSGIDAAMLYDTETVYFFQSNMYYSFDLQSNTLNGGPYDAASEFIKNDCEVL